PFPTPNSPCIGAVYTPGSGWTAAPVPAGADFVAVVGIDSHDMVALNASFPWMIKGDYLRAYLASPLRAVPTSNPVPDTSCINGMNPATGHVVGYDETLGGGFLFDGQNMIPIATQPGST